MNRINWSKINKRVWAISDINWIIIIIGENIGFVRSNSWRLKSAYCILRLWHPQKCRFKRFGNNTLTANIIFLNIAFSCSLDQCDKNYFSLMSQFWVYFMVISLFHNLYFMNSAKWKTSVLLSGGSCIYLHNRLADGVFSLSYKCAILQNILWCSSPWTREVNNEFYCKLDNISHQ